MFMETPGPAASRAQSISWRRREIGRHAVDAIAQARRRRSVRKDVAKMRPAPCAVHFGARHPEAAVDGRFDRAFDRRVEARPPRSALELGGALEQRLSAAGA